MTRALASVALFLAILAPPPASAKVAWRSCAEAGAPVSLSDVAFSPDPVLPGQRAAFDVSANAATKLTSGRVTVAITIGTIVVAKDTLDLCDLTACPAPPGPLTISYDRVIPGFVAQAGGRWAGDGRTSDVGYEIAPEIRGDLRHVRGALAAARAAAHQDLRGTPAICQTGACRETAGTASGNIPERLKSTVANPCRPVREANL